MAFQYIIFIFSTLNSQGMKNISDTLSNAYERTQNVCNDVSSKYGVGYPFAVLWIIIAISNIAVGSRYFDECPAEPYISIYLLVNGCLMVALVILLVWPNFLQNVNHSHIRIAVVQILGAGVGLFLIGWLIRGSIWTFSLPYTLSVTPFLLRPKCNPVLYYYAFYIIIVTCLIVAGSIVMLPWHYRKKCTRQERSMLPWHYRKKCTRQEEQETEAQETLCA